MPKKITIPSTELWDQRSQRFVYVTGQTITIEHSLVSLSRWESKWHKPFISKSNQDKKTAEEMKDYVRCMTITQNVKPEIYDYLTNENMKEICEYIEDPMTATWFSDNNNNRKRNNRTLTSELIYYYMIQFGIPFECEKWHLNRLITLIKVCNEENKPKKNLSRKDAYSMHSALNAARRAKHNSKG